MTGTNLDAERVIQILGDKVSQGIQREAMQQVYAEQLEKQIEQLQEQLREAKEQRREELELAREAKE